MLMRPPKDSAQDSSIDDPSTSGLHITNLPDEIIHEIISIAIACSHWRTAYCECALALSRVCKIFYRITQSLLFKNIEFSWPHCWVPACTPVRCLYRTIGENPYLGTLCKSVSFHIPSVTVDPTLEDYVLGEELLSWLPNVTSFALRGGFDKPYTWPFLKRAFRNLTLVKSLTLSRECWDLYLAPVCDLVQTMRLQSLTIYGICAQDDKAILAPISKVSKKQFISIAHLLTMDKEFERSSSITGLDLDDFGDTPEALRRFLKLPKALEHFRFGNGYSGQISWDLGHFQSLLQDHRSSLKGIEIGALGREKKDISFLNFPNLETLNLSCFVVSPSPEVACATLLGPKLHTFIWDFTVIDQSSESWIDFGQKQKDWILKFAELAIAQQSALRKIEIIFTPDRWSCPQTREQLRDWGWPWDLMDEVRDAIKPDIELSYNKCWEKQECLDRIEERERNEREEKEKLDGNQDIRQVWGARETWFEG
ncbi:uncharacterized protein PAC_01596 [Phialocephala subalpina]|uniref:F-box domain-containing protein n=1 Tax=Phialocephala subalpina TaxID=576137 RepID=A0A1L7WG49_9HELO|nr:uncharacterized protein PAC_01596 [Phialocephala subalpina]